MRAFTPRRQLAFSKRVLLAFLRVFAILVAVQISGFSHFVTDTLAAAGVVERHSDDCNDEPDGRECPPGCPTCHCSHCGTSALPPPMRGPEISVVGISSPTVIQSEGRAPSEPELPSVYRPPRLELA